MLKFTYGNHREQNKRDIKEMIRQASKRGKSTSKEDNQEREEHSENKKPKARKRKHKDKISRD